MIRRTWPIVFRSVVRFVLARAFGMLCQELCVQTLMFAAPLCLTFSRCSMEMLRRTAFFFGTALLFETSLLRGSSLGSAALRDALVQGLQLRHVPLTGSLAISCVRVTVVVLCNLGIRLSAEPPLELVFALLGNAVGRMCGLPLQAVDELS